MNGFLSPERFQGISLHLDSPSHRTMPPRALPVKHACTPTFATSRATDRRAFCHFLPVLFLPDIDAIPGDNISLGIGTTARTSDDLPPPSARTCALTAPHQRILHAEFISYLAFVNNAWTINTA